MGTGLNGGVNALYSTGSELIVGGSFTRAGGIVANRIARWNGTSWSAIGSMSSTVTDIIAIGGTLYCAVLGGSVFRFNGTSWVQIGSANGTQDANLAAIGNELFVAGGFNSINSVAANRIAKWNGSAWSALGGLSFTQN